MPDNYTRAKRFAETMDRYEIRGIGDPEAPEETITDILIDAMAHSHSRKLNFDKAFETAQQHFIATMEDDESNLNFTVILRYPRSNDTYTEFATCPNEDTAIDIVRQKAIDANGNVHDPEDFHVIVILDGHITPRFTEGM